jgi:hypothetical protein
MPKLPRAGLGHTLFTWAGAYRLSLLNSALFIHPHWLKLRIGPYLRREKEKMVYRDIMRTPDWGMPPWQGRLLLPLLKKKYDDSCQLENGQVLICRDKLPHSFEKFQGMKETLRDALQSISRVPSTAVRNTATPFICVGYRSGDYKYIAGKDFLAQNRRFQREVNKWTYTPLDFFVDAANTVRQIAGWKVPIVVSTDAYREEITDLLDLGNATTAREDSALLAMLEMSKASVIIMGSSNFAAWSWFLGNSLGVFPVGRQSFLHDLGMVNRPQATYLFDDETELRTPRMEEEIRRRLGSKP